MKKLALYKCFNPRTHTGCDAQKLSLRAVTRSSPVFRSRTNIETSIPDLPNAFASRFAAIAAPPVNSEVFNINIFMTYLLFFLAPTCSIQPFSFKFFISLQMYCFNSNQVFTISSNDQNQPLYKYLDFSSQYTFRD